MTNGGPGMCNAILCKVVRAFIYAIAVGVAIPLMIIFIPFAVIGTLLQDKRK
jgi:hypothetical protein